MRRIYSSLSLILLPSIISVSAQAINFSLNDITDFMGITTPPPSYSPLCDQYPALSDKSAYCRSYPKDKVASVDKLPAAKDLQPDTLYLITRGDIVAPYVLKNGVGVLPHPDSPDVDLLPSGDGTNEDCGLCVMKFAEETKVAGIKVNMRTSQWKPAPGKGKERAIFYGATASSEFSESTIFGREDFVDLVHQYKTVSEGKKQTYHRLNLYAEGSQNLVRVENTDLSTAVKKPNGTERHVDIIDCTGTLSGNIASSATEQAGFVINNLTSQLSSSSVFYEPLDSSITFRRAGLIATDTPSFYIFSVQHLVTKEGGSREQDVEEVFRSNLLSAMTVYSNENRYFALEDQQDHYLNQLKQSSGLTYILGHNEQYENTDVDNSAENIPKLSRSGGVFMGNAMQLEAMCPVNASNYNATNPFPAVNGVQIVEGPANATVKDFLNYCLANEEDAGCKINDRLKDGAIGLGIGLAVSSLFYLPVIACICRSQRKSSYTNLEAQPNS